MRLKDKKIITILAHDFEDLEFWYPVLRLQEEGAIVHFAGENEKETYHGKYGVPATSEVAFKDVDPTEYDGLLIPGGWAPDKLRRYDEVLTIVQHMNDEQKPIGQICHAGWVLISAKILKGKKVTSTPGIKDDMVNAGAIWLDQPVVIDGHLVSSRRPPDLPLYAKAFADLLASSKLLQ